MELTTKEVISILDDMKVKIDVPKAAVTQNKRNYALGYAINKLYKYQSLQKDYFEQLNRDTANELEDLSSELDELEVYGFNDLGQSVISVDHVRDLIQGKINELREKQDETNNEI